MPKPKNTQGSGVRLGRLDLFVGFKMRRIQNHLSRAFAEEVSEHNLRSGVFSTLAVVSANPGISQALVSRATGMDKSVTVQLVDDLERRGFATRERSTTDRRQHALMATEAGERFLEEMFSVLRETESGVLHQIEPDELALLHKLLNRMYAFYEKPSPKQKKIVIKDS